MGQTGQLSREHSVIMSCSTFMTDGKCAARSAPPFARPARPSAPAAPAASALPRGAAPYRMIGTRGGAAGS
ncbi:hypothetical protein EYF80_043828 [Liparis tanakae]|uniref:Uncharacterized protein n=1 Tax=Liparis tanakae TaxID=230148 RepID=A0A4Z2FXH6_9TELE|nr:hypothetical protein EYF80_043828 [Liparis tanakae]